MTLAQLTERVLHKDVTGIPREFQTVRTPLTYSGHARRAWQDEVRTGKVKQGTILPGSLPAGYRVVEVTLLGGKLVRSLVRFRWTDGRDLVMSIKYNGAVLTVWTNLATDHHRTLDRGRYEAQL